MNKGSLGLSLLCLILSACHSTNDKGLVKELGEPETLILHIDLPGDVRSTLVYPTLYYDKGSQSEYLGAYSPFDHELVLFNLTKRHCLGKIVLDKQGPDKVGTVGAITIVSLNEVWLASDFELTKIDSLGKVFERIKTTENDVSLEDFDFSGRELFYNSNAGLQYNDLDGSVLLNINTLQRSRSQLYRGSRLAKLSLERRELTLLDITFPDEYSELDGDFGELTVIGFGRSDRGIAYNFPMSSDIFLFNDGESQVFRIESLYGNRFAKPIRNFSDGEDLARFKHQYEALTYFPVVYDPFQKYHYRGYKGSVSSIEEEASYYWVVMDENFNKLLEFAFPENYYISPIVSKEGVMFMAYNKHDDKLELIRYRF